MLINFVKRVYSFCRETVKGIVYYPQYFSLRQNLSHVSQWWKSLDPGHNSMADASPWICFAAIRELKMFLRPDMNVFEYGSGGSTLFFSQRCREVISVEHHNEWYERVNQYLSVTGTRNVKYFLIAPEPDSLFATKDIACSDDFISYDAESTGKNFERYVKKIDEYPDESFDVVVIDGRSRPSCCARAIPKVKKGGMLIFDNVEMEYYRESIRLLTTDQWNVREVYGCVPYIKHFSMTLLAVKK